MRRTLTLLALILAAGTALLFGWTRPLPVDAPFSGLRAGDASVALDDMNPGSAPALRIRHDPIDHDDLPPVDEPFARARPALLESARAGSGIAACRLALSTLLCSSVHQRQKAPPMAFRLSDGLLPDDPEDDAHVADLVARRTAELPEFLHDAAAALTLNRMAFSMVRALDPPSAEEVAFCDGAPSAEDHQLREWVRDAALAGEMNAMLMYASGGIWQSVPLDPAATTGEAGDRGVRFIDHPEIRRWMVEAPQVLDAAIERGSPVALLLALRASRGGSLLAAARRPDPRRDAILGVVALRLEGRSPVPSTAELGLDPLLAPAADAEAERLYMRSFAAGAQHVYLPAVDASKSTAHLVIEAAGCGP